MKILRIFRVLSTLLTLFVFISCGTSGVNDFAGGGIGGTGISTGISVGKITKFGSVWVNGVEFDTKGASFTVNGSSGTQDALRIGMVVTVKGTFEANGTTGTAERVDFKDNLEGPIASVDTINNTNTFVVLGQTVIVDTATILENNRTNPSTKVENDITAILTALDSAKGYIVEVSGFVEADGSIRATYIELKDKLFSSGEEIELKGTISNLDSPVTGTFTIGTMTVDYHSAALPPGGLSNGLFVEVKSTQGIVNGVLIASAVQVEEKVPEHKEGDRLELEGMVTEFTSVYDFKVNDQPVRIITPPDTPVTVFENNASSSDLALNVRLEVEGTVDADGILVARKISIEDKEGEGADKSLYSGSTSSAGTSSDTPATSIGNGSSGEGNGSSL